jgi:hypothetical protein
MGTVYQLLQWFYIDLQVGVARYSAIYGVSPPAFAAYLDAGRLAHYPLWGTHDLLHPEYEAARV